jgi:uncharacterized lipoprotein YddW (UPF0748 family)
MILLLTCALGLVAVQKAKAYEDVSNALQQATNYLEVRPRSSRSNQTLTLSQLRSFKNTVSSFVDAAHLKMYDIPYEELNARLNDIDDALDSVSTTTFHNDFKTYYGYYEELFSIYGKALESRVIDGRGMWHRPYEKNLEEVVRTLDEMVDMGINMLYVETFWLGRLIYDSGVPGTHQHGFTRQQGYGSYGTNLLKAFVEEGKKRGIEVHAWVENFFVGYGESLLDSPILSDNPEWASYNYDGSIPQRSEVNYLFMDPANPEVRRYLKEIYAEIAASVEIGSIHLDYIRYPVAKQTTSSPANNLDTGYSAYAEAEFKNIYGYVGNLRELVISDANVARDWKTYKKNVISDFVAGVYYTIKNVDSNLGLSTAIFGNVTNAISEKMQDWDSWTKNGYIEIIMPMSYYQSSLTVGNETDRLTSLVDLRAYSYAGIAPTYMGYNEHLNAVQIQAALANHAQGVAFFASQFYQYVRNDYGTDQDYALEVQSVLKDGPYRNEAILPHEVTSSLLSTQFSAIKSKAERIYLPRNGMTSTNLADLERAFDAIEALNDDRRETLDGVIEALEALSPSDFAMSAARDRIMADINDLIDLLKIKRNRYNLDDAIDTNVDPDPDTMEEPDTLATPANITIDERTLTWDSVGHAIGYEVTAQRDGEEPIRIFVETPSLLLDRLPIGNYRLSVRAKGDTFFHIDSSSSETIDYEVVAIQLETPTNLRITDGVLHFDPVHHAVEYEVKINYTEFTTDEHVFDLNPFDLPFGQYVITVRALGNDQAILDSATSEPYTYVIERELDGFDQLVSDILKHEVKEIIFGFLKQSDD